MIARCRSPLLLLLALLIVNNDGFNISPQRSIFSRSSSTLFSNDAAAIPVDDSSEDDDDDDGDAVIAEVVGDDDDDEEEPGKMRVAELKSELELRGVKFDDCFDKESLVKRLEDARASGKADPSILNDFNKQNLEQSFSGEKLEIRDEDIDRIKANDGTVPGGMDPEVLKMLMGNPELMALIQKPKMQEAMQLVMSGEDLESKVRGDPELMEVVETLSRVMKDVDIDL